MVKRAFRLSQQTLDELVRLKKSLQNNTKQQISWDHLFWILIKSHMEQELKKKKNKTTSVQNTQLSKQKPSFPTTKIPLPPMKLPDLKTLRNTPKQQTEGNKTDMDLNIPEIPLKKPIRIEGFDDVQEKLNEKETTNTKFILVECQLCGNKPIIMPVPKEYVINADVPVVDIAYIHGSEQNKHVVVAQLDHDFQVRRRRASKIVYQEDFKEIEKWKLI